MVLIKTVLKSEATDSQIRAVLDAGFVVKERGEVIEIWAYEISTETGELCD